MKKHRAILLIVSATIPVLGCNSAVSNSPPPKIAAVRGTVVQKNGQPYTAGGAIQFKSKVDPTRVATGEIKPDGTFSISLVHENEVLAGAVEGPHEVTVIGPSGADQVSPIYNLKTLYTIEPKDNDLTVKLE